jgi:hypothetical protein
LIGELERVEFAMVSGHGSWEMQILVQIELVKNL